MQSMTPLDVSSYCVAHSMCVAFLLAACMPACSMDTCGQCAMTIMVACLQQLLELSNAQLQDLLQIQQVCMIKLALLEMERKLLVEPLIKQEEVSFPHDSFAALEIESNKLKENLLEAQKIKFTAGTVVFAGVRLYTTCMLLNQVSATKV